MGFLKMFLSRIHIRLLQSKVWYNYVKNIRVKIVLKIRVKINVLKMLCSRVFVKKCLFRNVLQTCIKKLMLKILVLNFLLTYLC